MKSPRLSQISILERRSKRKSTEALHATQSQAFQESHPRYYDRFDFSNIFSNDNLVYFPFVQVTLYAEVFLEKFLRLITWMVTRN